MAFACLWPLLSGTSYDYDRQQGTVVQLTYGDDGLNPDKMENNKRPVDFDRLWLRIQHSAPESTCDHLTGEEVRFLAQQKLNEERFQNLLPAGRAFLDDIERFVGHLLSEHSNSLAGTKMTSARLDLLFDVAHERFLAAHIEPGEAVGAIGAQSISEPGTQMTLKVKRKISRNKLVWFANTYC